MDATTVITIGLFILACYLVINDEPKLDRNTIAKHGHREPGLIKKLANGTLFALGQLVGWIVNAILWVAGLLLTVAIIAGVIALLMALGPMWIIAAVLLWIAVLLSSK